MASILLSGYHVGIENGIIEPIFSCTGENINAIEKEFVEPIFSCTGKDTDALEKEEILKALNNIQPDCKDVDFSLFGISLATLNFINSFVLATIVVYIFKYAKK